MEYLQFHFEKYSAKFDIETPYWSNDFYRSLFWEWPNPMYGYTETHPIESEDDMIEYLSSYHPDVCYPYRIEMSVEDNILFYIKRNYTEHFKKLLVEWVEQTYLICPK